MARPVKNYCDYFTHDNGMRNHRKVKAIRQKFGITGYAIWCMILELLTGSDGNVFEDSEIELEIISGDFGVTVTEMRNVLDYCYTLELLFVNDGFVYSESLDDRLKSVYEKRKVSKKTSSKQNRKNGKFQSNTVDTVVSVTETPNNTVVTESEIPQIKVNKIKVNKTIPFGEFGEKKKLPFVKVRDIFLNTEYENQDNRLQEKYSKQIYLAYCSFVKQFEKYEECVSNHSFIGIEFFANHIFNLATDTEISKTITKMCGLTIAKGANLQARFLDVLEMVNPKINERIKVVPTKTTTNENEWWKTQYPEYAHMKSEDFQKLVSLGKIDW